MPVRRPLLVWALVLFTFFGSPAGARVIRVEILSRQEVEQGRRFGRAGAYERILGRVYFAVEPGNRHNQQIVDLDKAPRNASGEVEFSADLYLLKPKQMGRGNRTVLFEVSNRGGRGILRLTNGATSADPGGELGDGFLLRSGYTVAWIGWQLDLAEKAENLRLYAPVAHQAGGGEIRGLVRSDFTPAEPRPDAPLGHLLLGPEGGKSYPVDDPGSPENLLTVRSAPEEPAETIPRNRWSFAHEVQGRLVPDPRYVHLDGGFVPGKLYELVYEAKNPVVAGLGLAAVRDFLSYLKFDPHSAAPVRRAYAVGISQSGRFLRHFLYQDFNADEKGRQVIDGLIAHVAGAGRGSFNHRFAQPSRDAQPLSSLWFPTDLFPFTDLPERDPETGLSAGVLDASNRSGTTPKIFFTNTSYEYWGRAASLIHTSADGLKDQAPGERVRIYFLAGLQHFSGPFPPQKTLGLSPDFRAQQKHNPNPVCWFWRALITDLDQWVKDGTAPPPSTFPRIADQTLVRLSAWSFPKIPGVRKPGELSLAYHLDFGPLWNAGVISIEPPRVGSAFPALVPQSDPDGNDLGGVRLPQLQVPLATYTGWNLRDPAIGAGDRRLSFIGSFLPLARTSQERERSGDPRLSIGERYGSQESYLERFARAARGLIRDRFLLEEDLGAVLDRGRLEWNEIAGKP